MLKDPKIAVLIARRQRPVNSFLGASIASLRASRSESANIP